MAPEEAEKPGGRPAHAGRDDRVQPRPVGYSSGMTKPDPIDEVSIGGDSIRLGQFLKFAGLLDSGGMVKEVIADGDVSVNGEIDLRRGRQLQLGDIVSFEGRSVRVGP